MCYCLHSLNHLHGWGLCLMTSGFMFQPPLNIYCIHHCLTCENSLQSIALGAKSIQLKGLEACIMNA